MAETAVSGLRGNITFSNTTPTIAARFGRWEGVISFEPLEATGFGATMHQRIIGLGDFQGQAIGYILSGDSASNPGLTSTTTPSLATVTLQADGTISLITATVMVQAIRLRSDILGTTASPLGITFLNAGGNINCTWGGTAVP